MKMISSDKLYDGRIITLKIDKLQLPSGRIATREVVHYPNSVAILPVLEEQIIFVTQYRHPAKRKLLELPAGKIEKGETPISAAKRELEEETGYRTDKWRELSSFFVSPGYSTEFMHLYIAEKLQKIRNNPQEEVNVTFLDIEEVKQRLAEGKFTDAKTILGILLYLYNQ